MVWKGLRCPYFDDPILLQKVHESVIQAPTETKKMEQYEYDEEVKDTNSQIQNIDGRPYLSPTEAGILLGISRATCYRYLQSQLIPALQILGHTIIRRSDVERLFDNAPQYRKRVNQLGRKPTSKHYTMRQIMERYNISKKMAMNRLAKFPITKFYQGRNVYYSKEDVEKYFANLLVNFSPFDYYTIDQIMKKFQMSHAAVLSFVMRHHIPRLTHGKERYYSKLHIDNLKGLNNGIENSNYYTKEEITKKYGLTKDQISYIFKRYDIPRIKVGSYIRISRIEFDKVLLEKKNGDFHIFVAKD
jgi:predicted DNA-binding transcriptional regulator AlpA/Mor family transcriptional regulator